MQVFRNPAASVLKMYTPTTMVGATYSIYDNLARVVLTGAIQSESTFIDISGLPSGVYYICVNNQASKHKIIKM